MDEVKLHITVPWKSGIHVRPATKIVELLRTFSAEVEFIKEDSQCNAKSILGILTLAAAYGESITVTGKGDDANEALHALNRLFKEYLGGEDINPF